MAAKPTSPDRLGRDDIRNQLERILRSPSFLRSERMRRFLRYVVEETMGDRESSLKEYSIAVNVYDKPGSFDPRLDSLIRVEANRLRSKLREYYDSDGRRDPILIELSSRGYRPQLRLRHPRNSPTGAAQARAFSDTQRLYLNGRYYWSKRKPGALIKAIECFDAALREDPWFALALAGRADCFATLAWLEAVPPENAWHEAEGSTLRALELEPTSAPARTTLACVHSLYRWNWNLAETGFREAIRLDERYATAHHWYAMFCLAPQRRLAEAYAEASRAQELDPSSAAIACDLARILSFTRRHEDAARQFHRTIELDPTFATGYCSLGFLYAHCGRLDEAMTVFRKARRLSRQPLITAGLGYVDAMAGRHQEALDRHSSLTQRSESEYVSPYLWSLLHLGQRDIDSAFHYLEAAVHRRSPPLVHLKVDPTFDSLKTDPRFLELLLDLGLLD